MPLDRNAVDRTVGEHIRQMHRAGVRPNDEHKRAIRRMHERIAARVGRRRRR
jgi:hypothetical protein